VTKGVAVSQAGFRFRFRLNSGLVNISTIDSPTKWKLIPLEFWRFSLLFMPLSLKDDSWSIFIQKNSNHISFIIQISGLWVLIIFTFISLF